MSEEDIENLSDKITNESGGLDKGLKERLDTSEGVDVDEDGVSGLADDLDSDDKEERIEALKNLAKAARDDPAAVEDHISEIIDLLDSDDADVKKNTCLTLGVIGSSEALDDLRELREESEDNVEKAAEKAIKRIERKSEKGGGKKKQGGKKKRKKKQKKGGEKKGSEDEGGKTQKQRKTDSDMYIEQAKDGLDDPGSELTQLMLVWSLEEGDKQARQGVEKAMRKVVEEYPDAVKPATSSFAGMLNGQPDDLRRYASRMLEAISSEYPSELEGEIDDLLDSLGDDDETVRENATSALTNAAEEFPDKVVQGMAEKSAKDAASGD